MAQVPLYENIVLVLVLSTAFSFLSFSYTPGLYLWAAQAHFWIHLTSLRIRFSYRWYCVDPHLWLGVCASLYFIIIIVSPLQNKKGRARICIIFAGLFHFRCWCRWSVPPNPTEQTKLVEHIIYVHQWLSLSLYTSESIANTCTKLLCAFKHHAFKAYCLSTGYYWIYSCLLYCAPDNNKLYNWRYNISFIYYVYSITACAKGLIGRLQTSWTRVVTAIKLTLTTGSGIQIHCSQLADSFEVWSVPS